MTYRASNGTADRALRVLALFDEERPVVTAADVARELGVGRSTAYRYVKGLVAAGFLAAEPGGGLTVGPRVVELAELARPGVGIGAIALPAMRELRDATGETVLLTRRTGLQVVCVERVEAHGHVRISYERGATLPLHAGAGALVLLAWDPEPTARRLLAAAPLERFTPRTIVVLRDLVRELAASRERGYSVCDEEIELGVRSLAVPVFDRRGAIAAAMTISTRAERMMVAEMAKAYLPALLRAQAGAARQIG